MASTVRCLTGFLARVSSPSPADRPRDPKAKRGTSDATYGYDTMGKLMILKLREDYRKKMGVRFVRKAMLGDVGRLF